MAGMHQRVESRASFRAKLFALLALVGLVALTNGCAALAALPIGSLVGSPNTAALQINNTTEVRLQERNFIVIKTNVMGHSSGFSLLGVVTIVPARFTKAMNRLYTQAEMQPGRPQTLANLIMEQNSTFWILFSIPRTSIRADVIEFTPNTVTDLPARAPPEATKSKVE
jgi:hypothetical protein